MKENTNKESIESKRGADLEVADHGDVEAVDLAELGLDAEHVEERLRGMLVRSVTYLPFIR